MPLTFGRGIYAPGSNRLIWRSAVNTRRLRNRRRRRYGNRAAYNYIGKRTVPTPNRAELKRITDGVTAQHVGTSTIAEMCTNLVVPLIAQGDSEVTREGNVIKPYRLNLKAVVTGKSSSSNYGRLAVLRETYFGAVTSATYIPTYTELANANLLLDENATPVAISSSNDPSRMAFRWNDKIVRPYRDKIFPINVLNSENDLKIINYSLKLRKHLNFKGSLSSDGISPRIFFIFFMADRIDNETPSDDQARVVLYSTLYYTDV